MEKYIGILELENGDDITVVLKNGYLIAGGVTNAGMIPEYKMKYDKDFSLDKNLQEFYDYIEEHSFHDSKYSRKRVFDSKEYEEDLLDYLGNIFNRKYTFIGYPDPEIENDILTIYTQWRTTYRKVDNDYVSISRLLRKYAEKNNLRINYKGMSIEYRDYGKEQQGKIKFKITALD